MHLPSCGYIVLRCILGDGPIEPFRELIENLIILIDGLTSGWEK